MHVRRARLEEVAVGGGCSSDCYRALGWKKPWSGFDGVCRGGGAVRAESGALSGLQVMRVCGPPAQQGAPDERNPLLL